jgi:hypothetical protein
MVYEAVRQGTELQKSAKAVSAAFGELNERLSDTQRAAVGRIGMTTLEFNQYQKAAATESGGIWGANTRPIAIFAAQMEKAFGLDKGMMQGVMPSFRMSGGKDLQGEIYQLLFDLNKSGMINLGSKNFARLSESLEYYNKLNMMQSQYMLRVDPSRSSSVMSALAATGLPFLSDQRVMQTMQSFDNAIRNPNNDYTRAFMYQTLGKATGGDFVDTRVLMEQGIFGKGSLEAVLKELRNSFAGNKPLTQMVNGQMGLTDSGRAVTIALQSAFNLPWALSKNLVTDLLSDEKKAQSLFSDLNILSEGEGVGKDAERYKAARRNVEKSLGTSIPARAEEKTAFSEELLSRFHNFLGEMGLRSMDPLFGFLKKNVDIFGDKPGSAMNALGGAIGAASAGEFSKAVEKFGDFVDRLNPFSAASQTVSETDAKGAKIPAKFQAKGRFGFHPMNALFGGVGRLISGTDEDELLVSRLLDWYSYNEGAPFQGQIKEELNDLLDESGGEFRRDAKGNRVAISDEKRKRMKDLLDRMAKTVLPHGNAAPSPGTPAATPADSVGTKTTGSLEEEMLLNYRRLNSNLEKVNGSLSLNTESNEVLTRSNNDRSSSTYRSVLVG